MSDKEKFEAKKNGQDIDEGVATVLQNTDWAKEKSQEETSVEVPVEEPAVHETEVQDTVVSEELPAKEPEITATTSSESQMNFDPDVKLSDVIPISLDGIDLGSTSTATVDEVPSIETSVPLENTGVNTSGNFDFGSVSSFETQTPTEVQTFNNSSMDTQMNNYSNMSNDIDNGTSNSELFSNSYDDVISGTKTIAAVVTEQDELNAKSANMNAYEKLYDAGPGKQISILRNFSGEAAKWIRAADKSGFVSGEMHDIAKKILREYEGLKEEQDEFTDDKIIPFNSNYNGQSPVNQFNNFSGMNNNDNIVQFSGNNDAINSKPFAA